MDEEVPTTERDVKPGRTAVLVAGVLVVVGGTTTAIFGLANLSTFAIVAITTLLLATVGALGLAITDDRLDPLGYWIALAGLGILLLAIPIYHFATQKQSGPYTLLLGGSDTETLSPSGSPGGSPDPFLTNLAGAESVQVDCYVPVAHKNGREDWYLVAGSHPEQWIEGRFLKPLVTGAPTPAPC